MDKTGYSLVENTIIIKRELNSLDIFVMEFIEVLKKHTDYLIVSGFVSISTGRTRGTEDVDVIFPLIEREKFINLFKDLIKHNFWCYQSDNPEEVYNYLKNFQSIRFAKKDQLFPNIEFIPFDSTKKLKSFEFNHPQKIKISNFEFKIPPIEFEILYKELLLSSQKDMADARHLREFFSDLINKSKLEEYKNLITKYKK